MKLLKKYKYFIKYKIILKKIFYLKKPYNKLY